MIRENLNVTINSYSLSGEIIVPSTVMTATVQEENGELAYSPNFQLKLVDTDKKLKVTDVVNASFSLNGYDYTSYMNVINRSSNIVTLQYIYGLTYEENDSSDDEPVVDPVLSQSINNILGTNYEVINDMSEEDATDKANEILYGEGS